jgi:hypothetical protein
MNKKTLVYSLMFLSFVALAGTGMAMAADNVKTKNLTTDKTTCDCGYNGLGNSFRGGQMVGGPDLEIKAEILGMMVEDLQTSLDEGKKFDEIAQERGIDIETMRTKSQEAMQVKMQERLAQDVIDGKITQAQADEMIANMGNGRMNGSHKNFPKGEGRGKNFRQPETGEVVE